MKHSVSFIAVALLLFAASCVNDSQTETVSVDDACRVSFVASFDNTRTAINAATGKVSWCEGDLVRYYSKSQGDVSSFTIGPILNGGTTQFEPNIGWSDSFLIAVYGGSGVSDNSESAFTLTGAVTAEQSGKFADSHIAAARISKDGGSWPEAISFSNLVPFLSFALGQDAPAADYAVFEAGDNARLHADGKILVSFDGDSVSWVSLPSEGGGSSIKIPVSGAGTYYIAMAPGTYSGFKLSFYKSGVSGDNLVAEVSSDKVLPLSRGKLLRLGTIDSRMEIIQSGPDAVNLSFISVPQDINNGVAAFKYRYLRDNYYKINSAPVGETVEEGSYATIKFPQDGKRIPAVEGSNGAKVPNILAWTKNNGSYSIGGKCLAEYDIKPADSSIDGLPWFWNWGDSQNGSFTSSVSWQPSSPVVDSYENGRLKVSYGITRADKLGNMTDVLSYLQLGARFANNGETKTSVSDYQAVIPYREALYALAFKLSTGYRTSAAYCPLVSVNQSPHLYTDAKKAAVMPYSVPVVYNAGPISLDIVDIHMKSPDSKPHQVGGDEQVFSIKDIQKYYPNFKLHFEPVSYYLGTQGVEEDKYCDIYEDSDGKWWFQPMYVDKCRNDGSWDTSARCSVGGTTGISAVGHRPIVLVTLVDTANDDKVVLEGYFKIMIVNDPAASLPPASGAPTVITSHVFDFNPFLALCNPQADPNDPADFYNNYGAYDYRQETKWAVFSGPVLEHAVNMNYEQFKSTFTWEMGKTYVKKNNQMVAAEDYGRIIYVRDTGSNDVYENKFVILFRKENYDKFIADNITEKELYAHFSSLSRGDLYLGFKASIIVGKPTMTFAQKNPKYWFDDLAEKNYNQTIRVHVKVPNPGDDDPYRNPPEVTRFYQFFDNAWVNREVKLALGNDSASQYYKALWGTMPVQYEYCFSKVQDTYKYTKDGKAVSAKFYVSADQKKVFLNSQMTKLVAEITYDDYKNEYDAWCFDDRRKAYKITYACEDWAKELLNAYEFNNDNPSYEVSEMLYFKIDLVGSYGACRIPCGTYTFPVRFIPPLKVKTREPGWLQEGYPPGSDVEIGKAFSIIDWRNYLILNNSNNTYIEGVTSNDVNLYKYYGIAWLELDIDKVRTDQDGGVFKYLYHQYDSNYNLITEGVDNFAKLWLANKSAPQTPVFAKINIYNADNLYNFVLHYESDPGSLNDYNLEIPYTIEYLWGRINGTVIVPVAHTSAY